LRAWPAVLTRPRRHPDIALRQIGGEANLSLRSRGSSAAWASAPSGLAIYTQLRGLPVHKSMKEISELIYETCKTYLSRS
jgi:K(+)-stimulated pyrophosphate-energized sodium pump